MEASSHPHVETDRVIVTEWRFAPGAETGYHVHAHDYVVVPLVTGVVRVQEPSGDEREVEMFAGASYARAAGVAHNLINANDYEFRFVEVELREDAQQPTTERRCGIGGMTGSDELESVHHHTPGNAPADPFHQRLHHIAPGGLSADTAQSGGM